MKNALFLVFSLFIASSTGFTQSAAGRAVLNAEARRFEAMTRSDTLALRPLLAGDLVYIHSNGLTETRSEHLQNIAAGRLVYQTMQREAVQVRLYGKTALTNGIVHVTGILNGNSFDVRLRYTAVYRRRGHWRLANWQSTRI